VLEAIERLKSAAADAPVLGGVLGGKHLERLAAPALICVLRALRDGGASPILRKLKDVDE
jgi:hypothetical protein